MNLTKPAVEGLLAFHFDRRDRILKALEAVKPGDLVRDLGFYWGDLRELVVHGLAAEEFWVQHVLQGRPKPKLKGEDYADAAALQRLAGEVKARTEEFVAALTDEELGKERTYRFSDGEVRFTVSEVFLHLVTHEHLHRGEAIGFLQQMRYETPDVDLL